MPADEPYVPSFDDPDDAREAMRASRAESHAPERTPPAWQPPQGRGERSLLPPADAQFSERLRAASEKLDLGEALTHAELVYLAERAMLRLMGSRRPGSVAYAVGAVGRMIGANVGAPDRRPEHSAMSVQTLYLPGTSAATRAPSPGS